MLVLTRKKDEQIRIGDDITITVVKVKGKAVRLGIEAPRSQHVLRGEPKADTVTVETPIDSPREGIRVSRQAPAHEPSQKHAHPLRDVRRNSLAKGALASTC